LNYDKYGEKGLYQGVREGQLQHSGYSFDGNSYKIFSDFFGSSNPWCESDDLEAKQQFDQANKEHQDKDCLVVLECTLHEFYNGALKQASYDRKEKLAGGNDYKVVSEKITIEIKPGYSEETVLRFKQKGNESFHAVTSDLVVKFKQEFDSNWSRNGHDLAYKATINLEDALMPKPI